MLGDLFHFAADRAAFAAVIVMEPPDSAHDEEGEEEICLFKDRSLYRQKT